MSDTLADKMRDVDHRAWTFDPHDFVLKTYDAVRIATEYYAELVAERDRLRNLIRELTPGQWRCTWWHDITHAPDCECEAADGYVIEEMDTRCTEGPPYPVLVYDDGQYVLWALDLREIGVAVEAWSAHDLDAGALMGAVTRAALAAIEHPEAGR